MEDKKKDLTGIIIQDDLKVTFCATGFLFTFMPTVPANESDIPGLIFKIADFGTLHPKNNFLKG